MNTPEQSALNCPACSGQLPDNGTAFCSPGCRYHVARFLGDAHVREQEQEAMDRYLQRQKERL